MCCAAPFSPSIRSISASQTTCCAIIDYPQALRDVVQATGTHPTHEGAETVLEGEIGSFLDQRSAEWKRISDPIWDEPPLEHCPSNLPCGSWNR
jgi:hypothetical protein